MQKIIYFIVLNFKIIYDYLHKFKGDNVEDKLLKRLEVQDILKVSVRKFYEDIITDPTFPQPFTIGKAKTKLYSKQELQKWIKLQMQNNRVKK